jgi:MtrB/PioB family decaheme-associated outer membrane protein
MKNHQKFLKSGFSGLLVLPLTFMVQATAFSADDGDKDSRKVETEFEIGVHHLDKDSFRFGKYTGVTEEGYEPAIEFKLQYRPDWDGDDTRSWRFQGWRIGLDSQRIEFDYLDQGTQRFTADYREMPNYRFSDGMSPFEGVGTTALTLPANWIAPPGGDTDRFDALEENLGPVSNKWERQRLDLSYNRQIGKQWSFSVDWRHESKDGLRSFGGMIGNSGVNPHSVILPAPIDWETDIMEAAFDFGNSRYQFGFGLYASWFDNGQPSVTWQNPYGKQSGWFPGVGYPDGFGLYSLEPNNEAMQFRIYAGVNLSPTSRLSADVSFGTMEQDDMLLAYSVNPVLPSALALPREFMDAEIETTHANLRYTARPMDRVSLVANFTMDHRANKTPRDTWIYIEGDAEAQKDPADGRINLPFSYYKEKFDLTAIWRAAKGVRIKAGFDSNDYSRSYSEVTDSEELRFFAGISLKKWEKASLSFDYSTSDRDVGEYTGNRTLILSHVPGEIDEGEFNNLPALRKYDQTDRSRSEYRVRADFFPASNFNFAFTGSWFEDEYNDTSGLFGLQGSDIESLSVDLGYYPKDGINLSAYYTTETYDSLQSSRAWAFEPSATDPNHNWQADTKDDVDTWNVALTFSDLNDGRVEFGLDYTRSNVESDIGVTGAANVTTAGLPLLVSEMTSWSLFGSYAINDRSALRFSFEDQELITNDFALDGIPVDGPDTVLLLGQSAANYDLSLFMLSYSYRY